MRTPLAVRMLRSPSGICRIGPCEQASDTHALTRRKHRRCHPSEVMGSRTLSQRRHTPQQKSPHVRKPRLKASPGYSLHGQTGDQVLCPAIQHHVLAGQVGGVCSTCSTKTQAQASMNGTRRSPRHSRGAPTSHYQQDQGEVSALMSAGYVHRSPNPAEMPWCPRT